MAAIQQRTRSTTPPIPALGGDETRAEAEDDSALGNGFLQSVIPASDAERSTPLLDEAGQQSSATEPGTPESAGKSTSPFDRLSAERRRMLDELDPGRGAEVWSGLDANRRMGFVNITAVLEANGFSLAGLSLMPLTGGKNDGIQQDRLLFTAATAGNLRGPLERAIAEADERGDTGFVADKPEDKLHPGMSEWGGRQQVTTLSMQIGGGPAGAFVDIDEFRPMGDVAGTLGHLFEVLRNSVGKRKTDPFTVAKGLRKRGLDVE